MNAKSLLLTALCFLAISAAVFGQTCVDIRCPSNITAQCLSPAGAPVAFTVTATNICGTNVSLFCTPPSGSTFMLGTTTVNCTAIGTANGSVQTNRCSFTVTVIGNCPSNCLTLKCPPDLLVQCLGNVPPPATNIAQFQLLGGMIQDTCTTSFTLFSTDGPLAGGTCGGTISRTYFATDSLSNSASCKQIITVKDTIPPVLLGVPGPTNFQCLPLLLPNNITATDNCDTNVIIQLTSTTNGTCPRIIVRTWTARDQCTNTTTASQVITVMDTIPPTIVCPSNLFVQCLGDVLPCPTNVTQFRARGGVATDNCGSNLLYFCSDSPLSGTPCFGTITRTHTVMDACSNATSCIQTLFVQDTVPPVLVCPTSITLQSCTNRTVFYAASATDNCDPNVVPFCTPPSGSSFTLGSTLVSCQALDRCSNRASCTFTVTVLCPSNQCLTITNEHSACVSNRLFVSTFELRNLSPGPISFVAFTDLPPGVTVTPDLIHLPAPLPPGASTSISITVQDASASGLAVICFRVSIHNADFERCCVIDHCIPVPGCCMEISGESLQCTNPPGSFNYSFDLRNSSGVTAKYLFLMPDPDCFDFAPDIITIQPPLPSGGIRHFNVTLQNVQPSCGASLCFMVTLLDSNLVECCAITNCIPNPTRPTIVCPSNIVAQCTGTTGTPVFFNAHANTLCGTNTSNPVSCIPPSGSFFPPGTTTVTCQTLGGGITNKCQFTVTIVGNCATPCVQILCPSNVVAQCQSPAGATVAYSVFATNPCTISLSLSCVPPSGSLFPIGTTTVTCTAIAPGQTNRCQFPVTVVGSCSNCVAIICSSNRVAFCQGPFGAQVTFSTQVINLCGSNPPSVLCTPPSGSFFPPGTTAVDCQAGVFGTTSKCTFTVTVIGNCVSNDCVELRCPSNLTVACTSSAGTAVGYSVFVTNRCSTNVFLNCTPPPFTVFPPGTTTVHCTAIGSGFTNQCNFTIAVIGNCPTPNPLGLVVARAGDVIELSVQTDAGVAYQIESADSFEKPDWQPFRTVVGDGTTMVITDSVTAGLQRFYRVRMDP